MRIKIIITTFAAALFCGYFICPGIFSKELAFTPKEIVVSAISAYGGESALKEVLDKNSYILSAALYSPSGIFFGDYLFYFKKPNKIREEIHIISEGGQFITKIYNDRKVYINQNGGEVIIGIDEFRQLAEVFVKKQVLVPLLYLLSRQNEVNYIGEELINGRSCSVLEIVGDARKERYFFDKETFLILKESMLLHSFGKDVEIVRYFSEFKKVDGVLFPFCCQVIYQHDIASEMRIRKISFDEIDDKLFEIPEGG